MVTYLRFDGINDRALAVDSAGAWPADGVMTYEIVFTRGASALNGGVADAFCPANGRGLYLTDATFQLYWDFGSFRSTYYFNSPVTQDVDKKLKFEFLADQITVNVYEDGILHTVITSNKIIPAAADDVNIGTRYGGSSPCNALINSIKRTVPSSSADSRHWSADASDTSNTGLQPVLTEVLNGFDAIGVNMNTDGSDWVVYGGANTYLDAQSHYTHDNLAESQGQFASALSGQSNYSSGSTFYDCVGLCLTWSNQEQSSNQVTSYEQTGVYTGISLGDYIDVQMPAMSAVSEIEQFSLVASLSAHGSFANLVTSGESIGIIFTGANQLEASEMSASYESLAIASLLDISQTNIMVSTAMDQFGIWSGQQAIEIGEYRCWIIENGVKANYVKNEIKAKYL